jgi:nucleotide-binding universal stress UspA family protein
MKVLFAIDGSPHAFDAVSQVGQLLAAGKDEVALYCSPPEFRLRAAGVSSEMLSRARQSLAESIFEEARQRLPAALRAGVHTILGARDARHGIVAAAEQWLAQLIVVGARGLGRFDRLLLGSVSRSVVHSAKVPVWVARSRPAVSRQGMRIVLACESPELGRPAAELLARFSWPAGSECRALTVTSALFGGRVPEWLQQQARSPEVESMAQAWVREHDEELRADLARMEGFVQSLPGGFPKCQPQVAEGDHASEILAAVVREQAELVVVGVHRKSFLTAAVLGSTSEAVLNHAECSVLTVPHPEAC